MKTFYKALRILFLLAMIMPGLLAIYGVFEVGASISQGLEEFGVNFTVELLMLITVFLCWKASVFFKKKSEEQEDTVLPIEPLKKEIKTELVIPKEPVKELDMSDYPEMKATLEEIRQYQEALRKKNFRTGSHIEECLNQLLSLYNDIVSTPMKNTEKGRKLIAEINDTLIQIRDSLAEVYSGILEGTGNEAEITIKALRSKLAADGLIKSDYDIKAFSKTKENMS